MPKKKLYLDSEKPHGNLKLSVNNGVMMIK